MCFNLRTFSRKICEIAGPSVESKIKDWDLAIEKGIVPVEKLEEYNNGGYLSPYGKGYISQVAHERDRQIAIDLDKPISVSEKSKLLFMENQTNSFD